VLECPANRFIEWPEGKTGSERASSIYTERFLRNREVRASKRSELGNGQPRAAEILAGVRIGKLH
jgi:hypothetical protein